MKTRNGAKMKKNERVERGGKEEERKGARRDGEFCSSNFFFPANTISN